MILHVQDRRDEEREDAHSHTHAAANDVPDLHAQTIGHGTGSASPNGEIAMAMLAISVNTRPCIAGATIAWRTAISDPFVIEDMAAARTVVASAIQNMVAGVRPSSRKPNPRPMRPVSDVCMRRRKPLQTPRAIPPARMPISERRTERGGLPRRPRCGGANGPIARRF